VEREADHSPPSSAEVKERVELYLHSQYAFMAWCSVKAQGQFTFTLSKDGINVRGRFTETLLKLSECVE